MNTKAVYDRLQTVKREIEENLMMSDFLGRRIVDWDEVELEDPADPNELQRRNMLYPMLRKLEDVVMELEYLEKPIIDCGILVRNQNDRYELNGFEFTSGANIELLVSDPEGMSSDYWVLTIVEHDGTDYYAEFGHLRLDGLLARIR